MSPPKLRVYLLILVAIVSIASARIQNPHASFHTFDDIPSFLPSFSSTLPPPQPVPSSSPNFQDCLHHICKEIPPFTPAFNECLRQCFAGKKSSTGTILTSTSSASLSSLSQSSISASSPHNQPFCIDALGTRVTDRTLCASPTIQGAVLFSSRIIPTQPIDDLIAEFLDVTIIPPPQIQPHLPPEHSPLTVLTALYQIFQRLPEFLKIITGSPLITSSTVDQAYQEYHDARLELLNARTECAEFYLTFGKTPCTVALRSSVYALGTMRISIQPILIQDILTSAHIADLFKDLTTEWNKENTPTIPLQPSIEIPPNQPFLE